MRESEIAARSRNCQDLLKELEARRAELPLEEWPIGKVLPVVGLEKTFERELYATNTSGAFKMGLRNKEGILEEVTLVAVRFDPVEKPEGVGFVGFCFLRNEETDQECLEWCPQVPFFSLAEDPGFAWIETDGKTEFVFNHVSLTYFDDQEKYKYPKISTVFYTDDGTHDICHLRRLAEIPGKDNRLTDLGNGWKLLTLRPEEITGERNPNGSFKTIKQIAFSLIGPEESLNQQTFQKAYDEAKMLEGFSAPDEWAGINDSHVLQENVRKICLRGGVADAVPAVIVVPNPFPDQVGKLISLCHRGHYDGGVNDRDRRKNYFATIVLWSRVDHTLVFEVEVPVVARYDFPKSRVKVNPSASPQQLEMVAFMNDMEFVAS